MATPRSTPDRLFCALLKYWRGQRGMSQLDLANAAEVSSRHLSFLETGRARPTREMVLRLCSTLDVPMREQNQVLRAAGFEAVYAEPSWEQELVGPVAQVIERMLAQHEPYPMLVLDRCYDVISHNAATNRLIARFVANPAALQPPLNIYRALVDPELMRPFVVDWETTTRAVLARLHRQRLRAPHDHEFEALVEELFAYPDIPGAWRQPDFSVSITPLLTLRLSRGELEASFITTLSTFSAPHNVALEELQIESLFPADEETARLCVWLASEGAS